MEQTVTIFCKNNQQFKDYPRGTSLMDMVNQGLVKLDDPLEKYLPANVTVPTYQGHKI